MDHNSEITRICRKFGVADLYVFGSRAAEIAALARNEPPQETQPESDAYIGILPEQPEPWPPEKTADLAAELEDLLDIPRVDLVFLPGLIPSWLSISYAVSSSTQATRTSRPNTSSSCFVGRVTCCPFKGKESE